MTLYSDVKYGIRQRKNSPSFSVVVVLILGLAGAVAITRTVSSFLYEVSYTDPLTFVCVSFVLAGVSLLASHIPARRAARIDLMKALRRE